VLSSPAAGGSTERSLEKFWSTSHA